MERLEGMAGMKRFLDENFLLENDTAIRLYHEFARPMPIIDYHCHLDPKEIAENKRFANLTEAWLYGDHYKWRAMRANGIEEKYVTGGEGVTDYDRFLAWARTVPATIGNPLYHWSHLELQRLFGVDAIIREENARTIWEQTLRCFEGEGFSARDLIRKNNVKVICTTDDPADTLEYHAAIAADAGIDTLVLPSYRPDKALNIHQETFRPWLRRLEAVVGGTIADYDALLSALKARIDYFHECGCRVSDHALDEVPFDAAATKDRAAAVFAKALKGEPISKEEEVCYKTYTLLQLGRWYSEKDWAMQLHMHAHRNNNSRMFRLLGPDTGFDSIGDGRLANALVGLLDAWDSDGRLPRTIVYSLNARDNEVLAAIIGSFQGDGIPGKIQLGSAWWFNDTKDGMEAQMRSLANFGLLSRFVGMLTDSRSFLSYTRHEYFRRILCNLIGEWVENGEYPADRELLGRIVQNISYNNAKEYFKF